MPIQTPVPYDALKASPQATPKTQYSDRVLGQQGLSLNFGNNRFGFQNFGIELSFEDNTWLRCEWEVMAAGNRGLAKLDHNIQLSLSQTELGPKQHRIDLQILNNGHETKRLRGIRFGQLGDHANFLQGGGHALGWGMRYAHTGNLRTERYPFCAADYPFLRQLPPEERVLGDTEDQPFPALFLSNDISKESLVFAFLSQERAVPVFNFKRKYHFTTGVFDKFEIHWHFPQSQGYTIPAGESFSPESLYLQLSKNVEVDKAFEDYLNYLETLKPKQAPLSPVYNSALHCTWNYGVFEDQREASLIDTARFIAEQLPEIQFFLIDDGYLQHEEKSSRVHLDRFYPTPEDAVLLPESWPQGIRGFTDELRNMGLRPGIWWTPMIQLPCRLHDEHPEWFLRKPDGELFLIGNNLAYLDYSNPDALAFLDRTLAHIQGQWNVDAVKIDFWSQNFETNLAQLQNPECSGIDLRRKFFEIVRKDLPDDGIIMSCIAMGMGNPFLSESVDTFRCSMDIHDGYWEDQINNSNWMLPTLSFGGRRTGCLLNTDSIGFNPELPTNETNFRLTWSYITMGLIETGGRLEKLDTEQLSALKKLLKRCDRGYPVRCPDLRTYTGDHIRNHSMSISQETAQLDKRESDNRSPFSTGTNTHALSPSTAAQSAKALK
ncbi:alpha-galactosidase [Coraliomargarita algicola]|uniref:Alpha-galactosidase n=1 Tax=Coraliomargarita algicola TaxID=3092156 RepID=A0ABZ0RUR4_9BACT|nr:alpha-galactosidase [Coraliomargarita sp. J2-16]WPJ96694.1 alpha-galactosidase [Coraliomargarita sp. J2-16]